MIAPKKEFLTILNRVSQLYPTPTIQDFGRMREERDFLTITEEELKKN